MVKFETVKQITANVLYNTNNEIAGETANFVAEEAEKIEAVIAALQDSRFEMRTFEGIFKQVLTSETAIMQILLALLELRVIETHIRRNKTYYKYIR